LTFILAPSKRILSLTDPTAKMSKSAFDPKSRIELTHTAAEIKARIRLAQTDSVQGITYDPAARPGVANLLAILSASTGESVEVCAARFTDKDHAALKMVVTEAVEVALAKPREEFARLRAEETYLAQVAAEGAVKARGMADATLAEVKMLVGLA
jgi:tryptophanyl-tRNA synthetase